MLQPGLSKDKWKKIGTQRRSGVLAPLFSVYSKKSFAIGDLSDLKLLIDWAGETGNSILQLLPMNEAGSLFCPYDAFSSFALEPMYLSPEGAGQNAITPKSYVDYTIKKEKIRLLQEVFSRQKESALKPLEKFRAENAYWLEDFVLFKALKDYHQGKAWYEWEDKYKDREKPALAHFRQKHEKEILFECWLQWRLFEQFKDVKAYAKNKKILLNGDLPILVSRDSADVWAHPEFFKLEFAAGAPPDIYCAKGQRWGMPTYNWEKIKAEGFSYLKEKFKYAQNFYDILRIDHVVGLFRIWSIPYYEPLENQGLNGFFDPQDEKEWEGHGREILSVMLKSTKMFLCAEDLGIIPKACPQALKEFGIPGNDVQRWVKDYKVKHDFLAPKDYRQVSTAMLSTHDTTSWPAWWENEAGTVDEALFMCKCSDHRQINFQEVKHRLFDFRRSGHGRLRWLESIDAVEKLVAILGRKKEELADFIDLYENTYREKEKLWKQLGLAGVMREKCDAEIMRAALKISLDSSAVFCINNIFDYLYLAGLLPGDPYQYRINTPGTISTKNWSLTIPLPLEELLKHKVTKEIRSMIAASDRI